MKKTLNSHKVKYPRLWMTALTLFADILGWTLSLFLIWGAGLWLDVFRLDIHAEYILMVALYFVFAISKKLYQFLGLTPIYEIKWVFSVISIGVGLAFLTMLSYASQAESESLIFLALWLITILAILCFRWTIRIIAVRLRVWGEPVVVIAGDGAAQTLVRYFGQRSRLGIIPVLMAGKEQTLANPPQGITQISVRELLDADLDYFSAQGIHTLLVDISALTMLASAETNRRLFALFKRIVFVSDMEWIDGATMQIHDYESLAGIELSLKALSPTKSLFKRLMDICGALVLGMVSLPIWLLTIIAIKRDSPGPVFYTQDRVGKDGHTIKIYKFRSMVENAEQVLADYLALNSAAQQEWKRNQKLKNDPRITRPGKWIRRFSIDEIPQLLNILKGEMSLVGPRPIMLSQVEQYGKHIETYYTLRTGLTGMWQVSGRNHTSFEERIRYDLYYARNWSIWLDLYILARTVWVVLIQSGAY